MFRRQGPISLTGRIYPLPRQGCTVPAPRRFTLGPFPGAWSRPATAMLTSTRRHRLASRPFVILAAVLLASWLGTTLARAENWPGWRGPRGDGSSSEPDLPVHWNESENIVWRTPLPGRGHSSPIVWGDRIYTASCDEPAGKRLLLCVDRVSGKLLWQQVVVESPLEEKHPLNSYASGTPASDGQQVYVAFLAGEDMVVAAYDREGRQQWLVRPGTFHSKHGFCSNPVLFEDLVIVNGDHDGDSYLLALDRASGQTRWKVERPNRTRSYVTPIIREIDGRTQLIFSGSKCVASYDPRQGSLHWIVQGPTEQFVASPLYHHGLVFLTAGFPEYHLMAIRPNGQGDVTASHIAWRDTKGAGYVPSPVASGDHFLLVTDGGVASQYRCETGERIWMERLGGHFSGSPIAAGGLVYFTDDAGQTHVVRPGPALEIVAENTLGQACFSSPAASQGSLFFRGEEHLLRIDGPGGSQPLPGEEAGR